MIQKNLKSIGKMSFNRFILVLSCLTLSFYSVCQKRKNKSKTLIEYPQVKLIGKDTVMIFTLDQSREIARNNEDRKRLYELNRITNSQLQFKDSIILMQESQIVDLRLIKIENDHILEQMKRQQQVFKDEKDILKREIRRQRRHKVLSTSGGVLSFAIILYFYINK